MRILILGFGRNARELTKRVKTFPEFGDDRGIYISHIQVARNSLSYGPDLVVEIPDLMDDGWRTYKDGFQAVHSMSTTVSDFLDWAVEEMANGSFTHVIDCTSDNTRSKDLVEKLFTAAKADVKFILDSRKENSIPDLQKCEVRYSDNVDGTISILRDWYDGGKSWTPVEFSEDVLNDAKIAWENAKTTMRQLHVKKRAEDIENRGHPESGRALDGYEFLEEMIPKVDIETLYRFVVFADPSSEYEKTTKRNEKNLCTIVEHEMLDWFYGSYCTEGVAAFVFGKPSLEVASSNYYRYESDNSVAMPDLEYDYAMEYVLGGELKVTAPNGREYLVPPGAAYYYMPKINAPRKAVKLGTESLMFYYKEMP